MPTRTNANQIAFRYRAVDSATGVTLSNWRMLLAASRLRSTQQTLARIAADVGYSSEFSFIAAFTRVMDVAPGRYRRQVRTSIDAD